MPVYEYTPLDIKGRTTSGIIDAESSLTARPKLRSAKTFPVTIEEVYDASTATKSKSFSLLEYFSRVSQLGLR